jgi:type II secretory pathway pseudopilin PulG
MSTNEHSSRESQFTFSRYRARGDRHPTCANRTSGFAYLWTLLLVAFMGVGLVIAGEVYSTAVQREKERELIFIGREFRQAIARYYESNPAGGQRQYPVSLEELVADPRFPGGKRYLRRIYVDPMIGKSQWGRIMVKGRIAGIYSLSEKRPIKQDNFESTEASFRGKEKYSEWVFTYPPDLMLATPETAISRGDGSNPMPVAPPGAATAKELAKPFFGGK